MPEWIIIHRKGQRRKAEPEEIPKSLERGVNYGNGELIPKSTRKRGARDGKRP